MRFIKYGKPREGFVPKGAESGEGWCWKEVSLVTPGTAGKHVRSAWEYRRWGLEDLVSWSSELEVGPTLAVPRETNVKLIFDAGKMRAAGEKD